MGFTFQEKPTILFYGDSITAGYGIGTENAFPSLIQKKLDESDMAYSVVNAGLSGETSAGGLNRIDWVLKRPIAIFVLELGANDGLRGLPLEETEKNLQKIIDKVKSKNPDVKILIAGMKVPPNMGPDYAKKFEVMFEALSNTNQANLIPFLLEGVGGNPDLNLPDGIHPNVKGHEILADNVWSSLIKLI